MAGWEPERMAELKRLFAQYRNVSHEDLFRNLKYFLEAVIPVCEQYDVKMAIHPDDPPLGYLRPAPHLHLPGEYAPHRGAGGQPL